MPSPPWYACAITIVLFLSSWPEVKPKNARTPIACRCAIIFSSPSRILDGLDFFQLVLERFRFRGVDRLFVHPAGVIIADLLHVRIRLGVGFLGRVLRRDLQARRYFFPAGY